MDEEGMGANPDQLHPRIIVQGSAHGRACQEGATLTYNMGGAAATFINGEGEWPVRSWSLGRGLLQFNANAFTLARMAQALAHYYTDEVAPPQTLYICSLSTLTLLAVSNPKSQSVASAAQMFHHSLTTLTLHHPELTYVLIWTPLDDKLSGKREARAWAQVASTKDLPGDKNCVQSAAYQKARAREAAYGNWTQDFLKVRMNSQFLTTWTGQPSDGHAHTYAIINPPDSNNHPLWTCATDCARDDKGCKIPSQPLYNRCITSTALQLTCNHAFTRSYSKRFCQANPPEFHSCLCSYGLHNPKHLILLL